MANRQAEILLDLDSSQNKAETYNQSEKYTNACDTSEKAQESIFSSSHNTSITEANLPRQPNENSKTVFTPESTSNKMGSSTSDVVNKHIDDHSHSGVSDFQITTLAHSINKDKKQNALDAELTECFGSKSKERDSEEWSEKSQEAKLMDNSFTSKSKKILARNENSAECLDTAKAKATHINYRCKSVREEIIRKCFNFNWFMEPLAKYSLGTFNSRTHRITFHT